MSVGRVVSSLVSCAAVAGCAVVVIGMTRAASEPTADDGARPAATPTRTDRPAFIPDTRTPSTAPRTTTSAAATTAASTTRAPASSTVIAPPVVTPSRTHVAAAPATSVVPRTSAAPATRLPASHAPARTPAPRPRTTATPRPEAVTGHALPLRYSTGGATRVITVTAGSSGSTHARLQAWTKVSAGRWTKHGRAVTANVGSDGIGKASESRSTTPAGSFTLTRAFGRNRDPGTALPYFTTTPSDYWISSSGRKYNTHQRCGSCGYDNGVNERLYYTTPYYNYAVVIDYNTRNAPGGVKQGRGSAFFLHVSVGSSTAGCVAIPQAKLVSLMRWLSPRAHPRILIGVT